MKPVQNVFVLTHMIILILKKNEEINRICDLTIIPLIIVDHEPYNLK